MVAGAGAILAAVAAAAEQAPSSESPDRGRLTTRARLGRSLLAIAAAQSRPPSAAPDSPQVLFKDLFIAVQTAQIYPDGKVFHFRWDPIAAK